MSNNLDALNQLAADYPPQSTHVISNTSFCVLFFLQKQLSSRSTWVERDDPYDIITDTQWDELEEYIDRAYKELMTTMIGQVVPYVTEDPPPNVLPCDGSTYLRTDFEELYLLLDPYFITDADHFTVPDLRGRMVIGAGLGSGLTSREVGDEGGLEDVTITVGTLPAHSHTADAHSHSDSGHTHAETSATATVIPPGEIPVPLASAIPSISTTAAGFAQISSEVITLQDTGDGNPHENMPPFFVLNYGIVAR